MKIAEELGRFVIDRTLDDEGVVYPHHIWRDPTRPEIHIRYVDVDRYPSRTYRRLTETPVTRHAFDPVTFEYRMLVGYEWSVLIDDIHTEDIFFTDLYPTPEGDVKVSQ